MQLSISSARSRIRLITSTNRQHTVEDALAFEGRGRDVEFVEHSGVSGCHARNLAAAHGVLPGHPSEDLPHPHSCRFPSAFRRRLRTSHMTSALG